MNDVSLYVTQTISFNTQRKSVDSVLSFTHFKDEKTEV
jgi:hypothetical protein